jgi:hypothetical protein
MVRAQPAAIDPGLVIYHHPHLDSHICREADSYPYININEYLYPRAYTYTHSVEYTYHDEYPHNKTNFNLNVET